VADEYVSQAEFKATHLLTGQSYADADIDLALEAASRAIDDVCGRAFYEFDPSNDQTRYYSPKQTRLLIVDDICGFTSLTLDTDGDGTFDTELTADTDFIFEPENADAEGKPYTMIRLHPNCAYGFPMSYPRSVELVGHFGWLAVPKVVKQAAALYAERLLKRSREAPFGIAALAIEGAAMRIARTDPDIVALISPLRRNWGIA